MGAHVTSPLHELADRVVASADNQVANDATRAALELLNGQSFGTSMLACAFLLRTLAEASNNPPAFIATALIIARRAEDIGRLN
jgi:hypothetical protein